MKPHATPSHVTLEFDGAVQGTQLLPQLFGSVFETQDPAHRWKADRHAMEQMPEEQTGVPFGDPGHTVPQEPQFLTSIAVDTHVPLHDSIPMAHWLVHMRTPPSVGAHSGVVPEQRSPHALQLEVVPSADSHPSRESPLQSAYPGAHAPSRLHVPSSRHDAASGITFGRVVQSLPHLPQWNGDVAEAQTPSHEMSPSRHAPSAAVSSGGAVSGPES